MRHFTTRGTLVLLHWIIESEPRDEPECGDLQDSDVSGDNCACEGKAY